MNAREREWDHSQRGSGAEGATYGYNDVSSFCLDYMIVERQRDGANRRRFCGRDGILRVSRHRIRAGSPAVRAVGPSVLTIALIRQSCL